MESQGSANLPVHSSLADVHPPAASDAHRAAWNRLVGALRGGGVALLPTDTIYGLHARWDDPGARARIRKLKGRDEASPLLCIIGSAEMLDRAAPEIPAAARRLIERYWPGTLTMVLPAGPRAPADLVLAGSIALRWPGERFLIDLVREVGVPLVSTSANPSGEPALSRTEEIPEGWRGSLDAVVDGGPRSGPASTLVRISSEGLITVLREGSLVLDPAELRGS